MSGAAASRVSLHVDQGVATIEFASPGRNAWDPEVDVRYAAALEQSDGDPEVRVVVVRGADGHFCPGRAVGGLRAAMTPGQARSQSHGIDRTRAVSKPVVAAIHGSCAGIGLTLALLCDVRLASTSAVFSTAFVRRGLPAGHGTSWLLSRTVGHAHASELLLSGRKLRGDEAARIGLVHRSVPDGELDTAVQGYVRDLAQNCSPRSMSIMKRQLRDDQERGYTEALAESVALADEAFGCPDFAEGVASYQERRPPRFPALGASRDAS